MWSFRWCEDPLRRTVTLRIFISEKKRALRDECSLMGLRRVACTTRHVSVYHALFSRSLSDPCLAHTHECERLHRLGLIQHWLTSPKQHRHSFWPFVEVFSSTGADILTTPGRMSNLTLLHRSIICSMRRLLISSHLLWTHAHTHIHTIPSVDGYQNALCFGCRSPLLCCRSHQASKLA